MNPEYQAFLESRVWAALRQDAFKEYGDACQCCGSYAFIQVHHLFYPRDIWQTKVQHLMPLCPECHNAIHKSRKLRATSFCEEGIEWRRAEIIKRIKARRGETFHDHAADMARLKRIDALRKSFKPEPSQATTTSAQMKERRELRKAKREQLRALKREARWKVRQMRKAESKSTDFTSFSCSPND